MDPVTLDVRSGEGNPNIVGDFNDVIEVVERVPRQHKRWQSVKYKGRRYQLFGGIHTNLFICLNNPIKGKS